MIRPQAQDNRRRQEPAVDPQDAYDIGATYALEIERLGACLDSLARDWPLPRVPERLRKALHAFIEAGYIPAPARVRALKTLAAEAEAEAEAAITRLREGK